MRTKKLFFLILPLLIAGILQAQTRAAHSVLSEGSWHKMAIVNTGVYKLTVNNLPLLEGMPFSQIALFGNDGDLMDEDNRTPETDDLQPVPMKVVDHNGNGVFDASDCILFYAEGVTTWRFNSYSSLYSHTLHPYSTANYVYLRTGIAGTSTIISQESAQANGTEVNTFLIHGLYEQDLTNTHNTGRIWVGSRFAGNSEKTFTITLPSAVSAGQIWTRIGLACPDRNGYFEVSHRGQTHNCYFDHGQNYVQFENSFNTINSSNLDFTLQFKGNSNAALGYLDFIEVEALCTPQFSNQQFLFHGTSSESNGHSSHYITANNGNACVWNVSRLDSVVELNTTLSGNRLSFIDKTNTRRDYVVFTPDQAYSPSSISALDNQDIHGAENPDMVIVCHPLFVSQAQKLASLHSVLDGMEVLTVTQDQVFNEFSSGKKDPMAIREMMRTFWQRYQQNNSLRQPRYLLLFGKGTFDNRDILQNEFPTVVTYQAGTGFTDDCNVSASDDAFGFLDNNEYGTTGNGLDLGIGRLPAKNTAEADRLVQKIENYMMRVDLEEEAIRGDWRTYITLLSDDADPSQTGDVEFCASSEYLANKINNIYPAYNLDKIYADSYTQQSGTIGSYYPDVNNALKQRMDYGCLLLNYIGHGSEQYIGTERYMEFSNIDNYQNSNRLPFFITSTCSFGKFDKLEGICGSEAFVLAPNAGIGCIAAARPISHLRSFNSALVLNTLNPANTIGDALRITKNDEHAQQNNSITLMGDPALKLTFPQYEVVVTKINGKMVNSDEKDSAEVLSRVTIEGEIRNQNGQLQNDFNGLIFPIVFDRPASCRTLANDNEGTEVNFTQQKSVLYKGRDSVHYGHFKYDFVVPRDVAYQFGECKLSHYAKDLGSGLDAIGSYKNLMLGGFDENALVDESHPEIRLYIGDSSFVNGGLTHEDAAIFAILDDEVGINAVGSGLGHDITAVLDGNNNDLIVLNDFYETDIRNPHRGYINYQFQDLTPGRHTLTLKAWNIYNYSASANIEFVVRNSDTAQLGRLISYPNPATDHTTIVVEHNIKSAITSARIDIYDMKGQRVQSFDVQPVKGSSTLGPVDWNLSNGSGATIGNGIYLIRSIVTTDQGETLVTTSRMIKNK